MIETVEDGRISDKTTYSEVTEGLIELLEDHGGPPISFEFDLDPGELRV